MKKWKFTGFTGLNTLFVALANHPRFSEIDFSSLKFTVAGGMAVTEDAARNWQKITGCQVAEGYGLTETAPVLAMNHQNRIVMGSIGQPVPLTSIKLVDNAGNDLPLGDPGISGEICAKGPQVMLGYWRNSDANEEVFLPGRWFRTGDIGTIDEQGYIRIVDRKKDMILVSGFNVYPNELENTLSNHPDVIECAAIGVPDKKTGEAIAMFVVSKSDNLTGIQIDEYLRHRLTPRHIQFVDELPKSTVGKILRRELRAKTNSHSELTH